MTAKITICIPTYNRAPMLRHLLADLNAQAKALSGDLFCIIVSDNSSTDDTADVLGTYSGILPMRFVRQIKNIGPHNNVMFCYSQSLTEFTVYCADDDKIDLSMLIPLMETMQRETSVGAIYCPWMLESGSTGKRLLSYFPTIETTRFRAGRYGFALRTILDNYLFPEISICRTAAIKSLPPHTSVAFWYFLLFPKILSKWDVIIADASHAFYTSYLDHPVGDRQQAQTGNLEAASAWDAYRGGMEVFTRLAQQRSELLSSDIVGATLKINEFVAQRQIVAMRSQCKLGNYIDALLLSQRIDFYLPKQINGELAKALTTAAAIEACHRARFGTLPERRVQLVGGFPKPFVALLKEHGMPWFLPADSPETGVPRLGWTRDSTVDADAFAEEFQDSVTF